MPWTMGLLEVSCTATELLWSYYFHSQSLSWINTSFSLGEFNLYYWCRFRFSDLRRRHGVQPLPIRSGQIQPLCVSLACIFSLEIPPFYVSCMLAAIFYLMCIRFGLGLPKQDFCRGIACKIRNCWKYTILSMACYSRKIKRIRILRICPFSPWIAYPLDVW